MRNTLIVNILQELLISYLAKMEEQTNWFNSLRERVDHGSELANWISECLNISLANAYKKINGQVRLTWEEYRKLENSGVYQIKGFNPSDYAAYDSKQAATPLQLIEFWNEQINKILKAGSSVLFCCHELPAVYLFENRLATAYYVFQQFKMEEPTSPQTFETFILHLPDKFYFAAAELKSKFLMLRRTEIMDPFGFRSFPRGLFQMEKQRFINPEDKDALLKLFSEAVRSWSMEADIDLKQCSRKLSPIPLLYNFIVSREENSKVIWEPFGIQGYKIKVGNALKPMSTVLKDIELSCSDLSTCSLSRAFVDRKGDEYQRMLVNEDY